MHAGDECHSLDRWRHTCKMATSFLSWLSCLVGNLILSMILMATSFPVFLCLPALKELETKAQSQTSSTWTACRFSWPTVTGECVSEASRSAAAHWREPSRRTKAQTDKRNSIELIKVYLHSKRRKTTVSRDTPKPLERKETVGTLMGAAMKQSRRLLSYRRIQSQTVLNPAPRRQRSGTLSWYPSRHTRKYLYLN